MHPFVRLIPCLLFLALLLSPLGGCGPSSQAPEDADDAGTGLSLIGAGSTFVAPLFQKWIEVYGAKHPELRLRYDAIGSGEGIERFLAGSVNVGATDAPMSTAAASRDGGIFQVPVTAGMIAITYNLPGVEGP